MNILLFGAHPDDIEFGMGGTFIKLSKDHDVTCCVLTKGEVGTFGTPEIREQEMKNAARKAGARIEILDFHDCQIFDTYESRLKLASIIRKTKPDVIFSPYHTQTASHLNGAAHPDHSALGTIMRSAARYARFKNLKDLSGEPHNASALVYYMVPTQMNCTHQCVVTDFLKEWEAVAKEHKSQLQLRDGSVLAHLKEWRRDGDRYVEKFYCEDSLPDIGIQARS